MTRLVLVVVILFLAGCAARTGYSAAPVIQNLAGYVAAEKPILWQDAAGCHLVVKFADGQTVALTTADAVCQTGTTWVKGQAAVPRPAAAPPAAQDGPK